MGKLISDDKNTEDLTEDLTTQDRINEIIEAHGRLDIVNPLDEPLIKPTLDVVLTEVMERNRRGANATV